MEYEKGDLMKHNDGSLGIITKVSTYRYQISWFEERTLTNLSYTWINKNISKKYLPVCISRTKL